MTRELTTESAHARALMQRVQLAINQGRDELAMLYAIPNGGKRSRVTAAIMKAEGVRAGVPDYCLAIPTDKHYGLYFELKVPKTAKRGAGRLSDEQKAWLKALRAYGYRAETVYGWEQAWRLIEEYLG